MHKINQAPAKNAQIYALVSVFILIILIILTITIIVNNVIITIIVIIIKPCWCSCPG